MLSWNFHPAVGGTELQCLRLSSELARRGFRVMVITQRYPGTPARERMAGIEVLRLGTLRWPGKVIQWLFRVPPGGDIHRTAYGRKVPIGKTLRLLFTRFIPEYVWMARAFLTLLRHRRHFDILHVHEAHWIAVLGVLAARALGKPVLVKEATTGSKGSLRHMAIPLRRLAARGEAYVAVSAHIASDLEASGIPGNRIHRIPNGVLLPASCWKGGDAVRPYVLFVGNLSQQPIKGIDVLIAAWPRVLEAMPGTSLKIVGAGDAGPLQEEAAKLGVLPALEFAGGRKDIEDQLLGCRAFVLPSRREGMSNALLEAMALGVPVVSTDVSGSVDLIRNGESGFLVPTEDPGALAIAVLAILDNAAMAARLGAAARRTVEEQCAMVTVADRYSSLYNLLTGPAATASR